jgi:glucans biosynthesis protein
VTAASTPRLPGGEVAAEDESGTGAAGAVAPSCGARLRTGGRCPLPPAPGKLRCFQHGGARGIGAPKGNRHNWRDGFYAREAIAERKRINGFIRQCLQTLREVDEMMKE